MRAITYWHNEAVCDVYWCRSTVTSNMMPCCVAEICPFNVVRMYSSTTMLFWNVFSSDYKPVFLNNNEGYWTVMKPVCRCVFASSYWSLCHNETWWLRQSVGDGNEFLQLWRGVVWNYNRWPSRRMGFHKVIHPAYYPTNDKSHGVWIWMFPRTTGNLGTRSLDHFVIF